ncbi:hypothetical protein [Staphylococcus agnetis]|uniref:hypothetical protein n=1 Tax=Staphylococcus agnetis TaxID=985762 RepID=UPI0021BD709E|nr:hypothetical protein [Staphylococcus agnetis]
MHKLKTRHMLSGTCITLLTLGTLYGVPNNLTDTTIAITSSHSNETNSTNEQPSTEHPSTEQPSTEEPSTEQPSTEEPSTEQPSTEEPSTEQPSTEEPSTEQPSTEEPSTEQPSTEEPSTEQPSTEEPSTEQPSTEEPSTDQPPPPPPKPDGPSQGNSDESNPGGDRGQSPKPNDNNQSEQTTPGSNRPGSNEATTAGVNGSNFNRDNKMLNPYQNQLFSQPQNESKRNAFSVANFNPFCSEQYYQLLDRNMLALMSGEFGSNDNRKRLFGKSFLNHQNEDKVREINQNGENLEAHQQGKQTIGNHGNLSLIKYMGVGLASIIFIVAFSIVIWKRIRKMN